MVSFTCENCGDNLKEDIAQHVGECKGPFPLTCIHCKEEFYDDQYTSHTSCASEVLELHTKPAKVESDKLETKSSGRQESKLSGKVETKPSSKVETKPSGKEETKSSGQVETKSAWLLAIARVSQSPSLTPQQSSLLEALTNLHNVPKKQPAFEKYARSHWKEVDAHDGVFDEVFFLIHEQAMKGLVHGPDLLAQEPTWLAAMGASCRGQGVPLPHRKIYSAVLSYYCHRNPIPISLPNQQSLQDLVRVVCKGSSFDPQMVNKLFDSILSEMAGVNSAVETITSSTEDAKSPVEEVASKKKKKDRKNNEDVTEIPEEDAKSAVEEVASKKKKKDRKHTEDVAEIPEEDAKSAVEEVASKKKKKDRKHNEDVAEIPEKDAKSAVEEVTSKKKKKDRKHNEDVAEIPEKDAKSAVEEVTSKKNKNKKHKRQEEAVEEEDVPRKKSTRSA